MVEKDDAAAPNDDEAMMKKGGDEMMKDDGGGVKTGGAMMTEDEAEAARDMAAPEARPYYIQYSAAAASDAMADGYGVMLYFYAAWCPICRAEEPNIKSWVEGSSLPVAGFRVNFDTEKDLKSKHKIPYQHTAVFLNAVGEEVERFNGPVTEAEFRAALAKAAGK